MTKKLDSLIVVGQIIGAFGVKGEAKIRSFTADPEACFSYGPLRDEHGEIVLTPVRHRPLNEGFGVVSQETRQREEWEAMRGRLLHVSRDSLPEPEDDEVYVADLIGLRVEHVDGRALGRVVAAPNFGAGDLLEIKPEVGPSFFVPLTHADVPEIDLGDGRLRIDPDEALLPDALQAPSERPSDAPSEDEGPSSTGL